MTPGAGNKPADRLEQRRKVVSGATRRVRPGTRRAHEKRGSDERAATQSGAELVASGYCDDDDDDDDECCSACACLRR